MDSITTRFRDWLTSSPEPDEDGNWKVVFPRVSVLYKYGAREEGAAGSCRISSSFGGVYEVIDEGGQEQKVVWVAIARAQTTFPDKFLPEVDFLTLPSEKWGGWGLDAWVAFHLAALWPTNYKQFDPCLSVSVGSGAVSGKVGVYFCRGTKGVGVAAYVETTKVPGVSAPLPLTVPEAQNLLRAAADKDSTAAAKAALSLVVDPWPG